MRRSHFTLNAWREREPRYSDFASSSNFASFLNIVQRRWSQRLISLYLWLVHQRCNIWPRGHGGKAPRRVNRKSAIPRETNGRARIHALVRLQRRKHNLIIMYGHISRMSPCLGQCTRRWYRVPMRFWHGGGVYVDIPGGLGVPGDRPVPQHRCDGSRATIILAQSPRPCAVRLFKLIRILLSFFLSCKKRNVLKIFLATQSFN